ncbi:hypothetical protein SNK03_009992 [Fusarium graminearum]
MRDEILRARGLNAHERNCTKNCLVQQQSPIGYNRIRHQASNLDICSSISASFIPSRCSRLGSSPPYAFATSFATKGTGVPHPRPAMLRSVGRPFLRQMPVI